MSVHLEPDPIGSERADLSFWVRSNAAALRDHIRSPKHRNNGEIGRYDPTFVATFTKGLPHDEFGIVDAEALKRLVDFLNQDRGRGNRFDYSNPDGKKKGEEVVLGPSKASGSIGWNTSYTPVSKPVDAYKAKMPDGKLPKVRTWESPLAGHVYDLEGPDADELTMPPAPTLGSDELVAEMAEIYGLALLRDKSFAEIVSQKDAECKSVLKALLKVKWFTNVQLDSRAESRRCARLNSKKKLTSQEIFRGSTGGAKAGPYLSQFMLIGNAARGKDDSKESARIAKSTAEAPGAYNTRSMRAVDPKADSPLRRAKDGYILYGTQEINQRVLAHDSGVDYLSDWRSWLDVQNGANRKDIDEYRDSGRFITTPRDLATYVHFDALYQAYLNACLLLLGYGYPMDNGFPAGAGRGVRDAFATFGGPHILSLLTEVASRALKLARRQKFNIHLRARPEAIGGLLTLAGNGKQTELGHKACDDASEMVSQLEKCGLLDLVEARNGNVATPDGGGNPAWLKNNYLLPMAFPEGSPMHPSYAAGHATVAGACVTILKAFFEMFEGKSENVKNSWEEKSFTSLYGKTKANQAAAIGETFKSGIFEPNGADPTTLRQLGTGEVVGSVTILGELDKLAANISIGRDMAGVHYYTDYYESLRMGERLAVGILQEQMLTYPEGVTMRLKSFDGEQMLIRGCGDGEEATVDVQNCASYQDWVGRVS